MEVYPDVRIIIDTAPGKTSRFATLISDVLERMGFEVIELSEGHPSKTDQNRERAFIQANRIRRNLGDKNHDK